MKNDLIARYIYAVTKRLPSKMRNDVSAELETLIDDMLLERCGDVTPTEKDIRVVLTELGTPKELYEKYTEEGKDCLIGYPYFNDYKFVLKIVLISVVIGMAIATVISSIVNPTPVWYEGVFAWLGNTVDSLAVVFTVITVIFAVCYHKGIKINIANDFDFDNLPSVPSKKKKISKADSIVGIVFSMVFLILFLFAPQIIGFVVTEATGFIPLFNVEAIQASWIFIVLFTVCGLTRDIVKLMEGRFCKKVMITTVVTDVITVVLTSIWLLGTNIMNPQLSEMLSKVFDETVIINFFSNFQMFLLVVILFALVLEMITTVVKTLKK